MAGDEMTLAFELDALKRMESPADVYREARSWSEYVGIVSGEPPYVVNKFARDHGLQHDFEPGPDGMVATLEEMRTHFETARYVFVAEDESTRESVEDAGWEHLLVEEAAEAAGWTVEAPPEETREREARGPPSRERRDDWP